MNPAFRPVVYLSIGIVGGFLASELWRSKDEQENRSYLPNTEEQSAVPRSKTVPPEHARSDAKSPGLPSSETRDFEARFQELLKLENGPNKLRSLKQLFEEWGAAKGEDAYSFAKSLTGRDHLSFLASAAKGWAKTDPRSAWDALMHASNGGAMLVPQLRETLSELASQDTLLATEFLLELESDYNRSRLFEVVLRESENDADRKRLFDRLLAFDSPSRLDLLQSLFSDWGRYDSEAPLAEIAKIEDPDTASRAMLGILEGWASVDGKGALAYALESDDPRLQNNALPLIAKEWANASTADEIVELIDIVSQLEDSESIIKNVVPTLARANPELALQSIQSLESETARANHTRDTLSIWASSNLDDAEAYYFSMPNDREKFFAIWGLFNPAMHQGVPPSRIMDHVSALGSAQSMEHALYSMTEYTKSVDSGDKTDALATEIARFVNDSEMLTEEAKEKILGNLDPNEG